MKKKRTNITINPKIYALAQDLMGADHFDDFSGYVEHLIREEAKRRQATVGERSNQRLDDLKAKIQFEKDLDKKAELQRALDQNYLLNEVGGPTRD